MNSQPIERVERLTKALRPILREKADQYKQLWLASDRKGREEVEQLLQLEFHKHFPISDTPVFPPPSPENLPIDGLEVGKILYQDKQAGTLFIPPQSLLRHILIAGTTGSGKTTLIYQFCKELLHHKIPFFLFDFKLDYRPLILLNKDVQVYTVGNPTRPLHFNPLLEISKNLVRKQQTRDLSPLFQISDVLCRVFYTGHGVRSILNKAFASLFREWVDHQYDPEYEPSFRRALAWVRDYEPKSEGGMRYRDWKTSTIRVLEILSVGTFGDAINANNQDHVSLQDLKKQSVVFELNLPEDLKTVFVETLLACSRQANIEELKTRERGKLQNVMIIDESHNLLKISDDKIEGQLQIALREDRGLGTAYIIADQTPSQLNSTAYANTYYKFFFALDQSDDIRVASKSLLLQLDQRDILSKLPTGQCLCRYGKHDAFLIQAYQMDAIKNAIVKDEQLNSHLSRESDTSNCAAEPCIGTVWGEFGQATEELAQLIRECNWSGIQEEAEEGGQNEPEIAGSSAKQPSSITDKVVLTSIEQALLNDILESPFIGINAHFKNMNVSTTKGRKARASLEQKGLLIIKTINLGDKGGQLLLAALSEQAASLLHNQGKDVRYPYFQNGGEHEYWKERLAQHFSKQGYTVEKETTMNGYADLTATKDSERIAIEVETGQSDMHANINKYKNKNYTRLILVATSRNVQVKLQALAQEAQAQGIVTEVWLSSQLPRK